MMRLLVRGGAGAIVGSIAGPAWLVLVYALSPRIVLEMDRSAAAVARGFHEEERAGHDTFAWTGREVSVSLPGLDRRGPWSCTVRVRGARPDAATLPQVTFAVDGATVASYQTTNLYQDLRAEIPSRPTKPGAVVTLTVSNTFQPGPADPRVLGVMVDRWACAPGPRDVPLPPRESLKAAAIGAAALAAAWGVIGLTPATLAISVCVLAAGQGVTIARGFAVFTPYLSRIPWLASWIALVLVAAVRSIEWFTAERFRNTARFAVCFSAAALYLKLLALLHPSKLLIDAVFHAHRFESVLAGRLYFTQPMPGGVQFPYAIGLYLFAAPWSFFTADHVTLLRVVVCAAEAIAGALLYLMIVRAWSDRLMGAIAVALFHVVPISYWVVGNANLTNAFGTSSALASVAAAAILPLGPHAAGQLIGLTALTALALLSHVSTFALLLTTLVSVACLYRWLGETALCLPARAIFIATAIAVLLTTVTYYGHFIDVYKGLARVRADATTAAPASPGQAPPSSSIPSRVANGMGLSVSALGWPIVILTIVGIWRIWTEGARDRLGLVLAGWGVAYVIFLFVGTLTNVDRPFQRYAAEFISRVVHTTCPAAIVLAARGSVWGWRAGAAVRVAIAALLVAAVGLGIHNWLEWLA